jgi:NAD(P)H-quinone oxidoreductase subunit 5
MLACSTMAQMGFMIAQCGMGLFAPAVSHLVWHGLFKAYLFLGTGSVMQEKRRKDPFGAITPGSFALGCVPGAGGAFVFAQAAGIPMGVHDTGSMMIGLAFMASTQLACLLLETISLPKLLAAFTASVAAGGLYGGSIRLIEIVLAPMNLWQPQALDGIYAAGFAALFLIWLAMNMNAALRLQNSTLWKRLYMAALNSSQPQPATITSTRTAYQF